LVEIGFSIRRVFDRFASLLGQIPVAVLMAVRCQLLCISLRGIQGGTSLQLALPKWFMQDFATRCNSLQNPKKQTQNPPALAAMGFDPPPGTRPKQSSNQ
jgi:hypothetical protein